MSEALLLALALSADAFSVALGLGATHRAASPQIRVATAFGGFQFLFAVFGWQAGAQILPAITPWDRAIAALALLVVAGKMFWESVESREATSSRRTDPTRGWPLFLLSAAVSIDALAAGVALEKLPSAPFATSVLIGVVTLVSSWLAMRIASRLAARAGVWAERAGALVLVAIALKIAFL